LQQQQKRKALSAAMHKDPTSHSEGTQPQLRKRRHNQSTGAVASLEQNHIRHSKNDDTTRKSRYEEINGITSVTSRNNTAVNNTNTWQHYLPLYISICIFRIIVTHYMIHSYFHPDEFWQTLEPAYCHVYFRSTGTARSTNTNPYACDGMTWEWTIRDVPSQKNSQSQPFLTTSDTATATAVLPILSTLYQFVLQRIQQSFIAIGPIRSYFGILPTILFYYVLKFLQYDTTFMIARGPVFLHIVLITVPIDVCTYYLVTLLYHQDKPASSFSTESLNMSSTNGNNTHMGVWYLFVTLSSWFISYAFTRTFANTYETVFLLLAIALVSPQLFRSSSPNYHPIQSTPRKKTATTTMRTMAHRTRSDHSTITQWRTSLAFLIGGLSVAIRITAVASFVPLGVLLAVSFAYSNGTSTSSNAVVPTVTRMYRFVTYLIYPCAVYGLLGLVIASGTDYYYNGYYSIPILSNLYFNVIMNYSALYGTHPWYWYWLQGLATVTGLLYPILIYAFVSDAFQWMKFIHQHSTGTQSRRIPTAILYNRLKLWILLLSYVWILSRNDHKEERFLSPVLPLAFILCTPHVRDVFHILGTSKITSAHLQNRHRNIFWYLFGFVWIGANTIAIAYLGLFHQSGPVTVNARIVSIATNQLVKNVTIPPSTTYNGTIIQSIHFLGGCHSTPLQSHLHIPSMEEYGNVTIQFQTWHLNCHPSCLLASRETQGRVQCETDQFSSDPISFLKREYCFDDSDFLSNDVAMRNTIKRYCRTPPDYIVMHSNHLTMAVLDLLQQEPFQLHVHDLFPDLLRGVQIQILGALYSFGVGWMNRNDDHDNNDKTNNNSHDDDAMKRYNHERMVNGYQSILPGVLDINWDAFVLLTRLQ
jgi:Alg9-like mannosyltransferase family